MSFSHKPTVRKKPRAPPKKPASMLALENRSLDSHDEDSILGIMTEEELKAHEEKQNRRAFSYLSADAVRWMQKRRPAADSSAKNFIPPSRVLQLRAIFRGLDFDGSGEIDLDELKDAVRFVASKDSGDSGPPLFEHPEQIVDLFESMDIDKNGNVDFDEFLIGMTSEVANSSGGMGGARMQSAFFDFANKHRRETIVEKINDTSMNTQERYNELRKLYNMKYLKEEPKDGEVSEMIEKMKKEAEAQKKEMNQAAEKYRRAELNRARAAFIYFENEAPGKGKSEYFSQNQQYSAGQRSLQRALKNLTGDPIDDRNIEAKANRTVQRNMCNFGLSAEDTYTPPLHIGRNTSLSSLTNNTRSLAKLAHADPYTKERLLPLPKSVSQQRLERVESARQLHERGPEKKERKVEQKSGLALANARRAALGQQHQGGGVLRRMSSRG